MGSELRKLLSSSKPENSILLSRTIVSSALIGGIKGHQAAIAGLLGSVK
jgi:hypothetical protein